MREGASAVYEECEAAVAYIDRLSAYCTDLTDGNSPAAVPEDVKQSAVDELKNVLRGATADVLQVWLKAAYANRRNQLAQRAFGAAAFGEADVAKALADAQMHFALNRGEAAAALQGEIAAVGKDCVDLDAGIMSVICND